MSQLAFPKPKPRLLEKRERKAKLDAQDRAERKKCRARSAGRCEVLEVGVYPEGSAIRVKRCARRASQNHHWLGGVGRRNKGASLLFSHRLDVCDLCHKEIEHAVLQPVDPEKATMAKTVTYWRLR